MDFKSNKSNSIQFITTDICIGVINSLCNDDGKFNNTYSNFFDLVVIDECHRLGADKFCNILNIYG